MANIEYLPQPVLEEVPKEVAVAQGLDYFLVIVVVGIEDDDVEPALNLAYQM